MKVTVIAAILLLTVAMAEAIMVAQTQLRAPDGTVHNQQFHVAIERAEDIKKILLQHKANLAKGIKEPLPTFDKSWFETYSPEEYEMFKKLHGHPKSGPQKQ